MAVSSFVIPSAETILQGLLSHYKALAAANGYPNISADPNSEVYIRFSAVSQQLAVMYNIMQQQMDARMVDTATGDDLDRVLNQYGLVRKAATSAEGFFQFITAAPQTLNSGMTLTGQNSLTYMVSVSGVYANGQNVPVIAVDQGQNTDLGIGATLTWVSPPPLSQNTVPVSVALTGGSDLETDAQARARLYATIQNPPGSGNFQQLINMASSVDPIVEAGFVYSNFNGAGTQLIALAGYQSDGYYIGRDVPHLTSDNTSLNGGSSPYNSLSQNYGNNLSNDTSVIYGQVAAGVSNPYATFVTTINNTPADAAFLLTLPFPIGSPVNGTGGGWLNFQGTTWPNPDGTFVSNNCQVTAVTSSTVITVQAASTSNATTVPVPGLTLIQWINRSGIAGNGWQVVQAKVLAATDNANNTWTITLDTPLTCGSSDYYGNTQVAVGDYIFPASINAQNYLDTVMGSFAALGPGQVTSVLGLLQIGANRQPAASSNYPPYVSSQFLQNLTAINSEVFSAQFLYNSTGQSAPPVAAPPQIWIPRHLAFYNSQP
jgi:hypothetical protein